VSAVAFTEAAGERCADLAMTAVLTESQESGARYRGLLEAAPDAMVVVNEDGEIVLLNLQAEKQFGYSRDELLGQPFTNIIPEGFAERLVADGLRSAADALAQQIGTGIELTGLRKDGSEFPIEIMLSPLESAEGILVTAAIRNISVRKAAEKNLAQMDEERHRSLCNAIDEGLCTIEVMFDESDKAIDFRFLEVNPQFEKQSGIQDALGKRMREVAPLHEEHWFELFGKIAVTGESARFEQFAAQLHRWFNVYAFRVGKPQERKVSVLFRDISERKTLGATLRESEERYRMLLDGVPDHAIFMMDTHGQIVSWNAGAERIKGYKASEIIGHNFSCFFPPHDVERGRPQEVLRITAANGRHEEQGMRVRKDGSRFLASVTFTALRDAAGNLRGFSEFSHDLSESKEAGAKYRGLLEAAPDAMVVVNQDGEIVLVNVQAEKQFGYSRDELIGQQVKNIVPEGFAERLIADGLRSAADALAQQIGTGIELTGLRKNGTEFPIEIMLSPLENAQGILVTAAIRDISVRKNAETHLAQMESRYRGLLEAAPDAMVVVNQAGEIVLLNVQAEKQFGYSRDELFGQQVRNIIPEGFAERLIADGLRSTADALAQQIGTGIELIGRRKDGSDFPIEIMLSPLENAEGILVTAAIRNITKRQVAEAHLLQKINELNRSNEELGQFAYIASHDLQEPLRMVASYTQLLSRRYKGKLDSDADEFIAFAVDGANRMQRLIHDLLAYSRVGTEGRDLADTSSERALQLALANLGGAIEEHGAVVTHDPLPTVVADEMQLVQLFQNLVGNAIKYQPPGIPRVHISAGLADKNWTFSVSDNGLGIDSKYTEKIFGMFQRLHKRDEFAGTGIGLAICKKIIERHGSSITVESRVGVGSTFRFALAGIERT
jgi:PAS domain S-box-containing protein